VPARIPTAKLEPAFAQSLPAGTSWYDALDLILDVGVFRRMGRMLGAGIVVYDESRDLVREALACLRFFQAESCGKCVPCRIGSQKLVELTARLHARQVSAAQFSSESAWALELADTMSDTSICGLGQVAPNPLLTLMDFFPDELARCFSCCDRPDQ
jgi:NADH:ubiquinone oxidoreductase subunit F (NADH-binding)